MSGKLSKSHPLNAPHTAGIFADPVNDGPLIGTLNVIVERAKNLPNRKTIGKQDPYCAARLGKEAKKTTTDIRGGQTPRWDQELSFSVHTSNDYFQLKVSIFNDDKKTDLVGEAWIDLRDIIVPGGGQNGAWHTLNCKGKYAGEVRLEMTYLDCRPKPENPAPQQRAAQQPASGPNQTPERFPKRRPLPSDPTLPARPLPDHVQTPPRQVPETPASYTPNQPLVQPVEYSTPPPPPARYQPPDQYDPPPARYQPQDQYDQQPPPQAPYAQSARNELAMSHPPPPEQYDWSGRDEVPVNSHYRTPRHDRHDSRQGTSASPLYDRSPMPEPHPYEGEDYDEDRPPPPPVHRSKNNSAPPQDIGFRGGYDTSPHKPTPPNSQMRHEILRQEAGRAAGHSAPTRPDYRGYDSAPNIPSPPSRSTTDPSYQQPPPRHYSFDNGYDRPSRSMQPSVEDGSESPTPMSGRGYRASNSRLSQYESAEQDAMPAPLNLGNRQGGSTGQYSASPRSGRGSYEQSDYAASASPIGQSSRDPYQRGPPPQVGNYTSHHHYGHVPQAELEGNNQLVKASSYGPPDVPPSLVPGVDPILAQEISDRIYEDRRHERRNPQRQQQLVATPPRGRHYADAGNNDYGTPPQQPQSYTPQSANGYSEAPSPAVHKPRGLSPAPQHTIRRKSVSPAPPQLRGEDSGGSVSGSRGGRRRSGVPFGPDSYDELNPNLAVVQGAVAGGSSQGLGPSSVVAHDLLDHSDPDAKIITHDGREIDPSDHLPMESWAPEPEPKKNSYGGQGAEQRHQTWPTSPQAAQLALQPQQQQRSPLPPSSAGRHRLQLRDRPHSMALPSSTPSTPYNQGRSYDAVDMSSPVSGGGGGAGQRNRLQKKSQNRASMLPSGGFGSSLPSSPLAPVSPQQHQRNSSNQQNAFTPPLALPRANTLDFSMENSPPASKYNNGPNHHHHSSSGNHHYGASPRGVSGGGGMRASISGPPPIPAKVPLQPVSAGALVPYGKGPSGDARGSSAGAGGGYYGGYDGGGRGGGGGAGGGNDEWSILDEISTIDIGTARSRRHERW